MVRTVTATCLATLKNGVAVREDEDKQQLTLKEELCQPDSDGDEPEEVEEEDEDEHENVFQRFLYSSHCTVCLYLGLFLLLVGSLIALVVVGVQVLLPFENVRDFLNGTCIPTGMVVEDGKTCMCGAGCSAHYRCLTIRVTYQDRQKRWRNATVYENESTLGKACSFYPPCKSSPTEIEEAVKAYEKRYGVIGLPFNCLYSAKPSAGVAIRTRRYRLYHVVNGILWSTILLLMASVLIVYALKKRGCDFI